MSRHYLEPLFAPQSIAVFGASERPNAVGSIVFANILRGGFAGRVYPINPKHKRVLDQPCVADLAAVGDSVDLAVIATPAAGVPDIVRQCGEHRVKAAVVLSAGFGEAGGHGHGLEKQLLDTARQHGVRMLGPNCLGLMRPPVKLNATFSRNAAAPGNLALLSQSGALCTAILDWAEERHIGFSAMVSLGNATDLDFGEVLDYLAFDTATESILLYVEGIRDARNFMSGLRAAARIKPVIVLKAGRHQEATRAAVSHTGAMVGADDIFDAALQRAGAVRAMTIGQLFSTAAMLAARQRVSGNRLAIVSNAGGPAVMATDRAVEMGIAIAELSETTQKTLDGALPPHWSHANPVDILGDAPPERYGLAVKACLDDPNVDGVLAVLTPQAMSAPLQAAQATVEAARDARKPLLTCWMGEAQVREAWALFAQHNVPHFRTPEACVDAFACLCSYYRNQALLMQVPGPLSAHKAPDVDGARLIIDAVLADGRSTLTGPESKALLTAFGIPVTPMAVAHCAAEALVAAESIGFPLAMKIHSPAITHKSDIGGVRLNIANAQAVRQAYQELIAAGRAAQPDLAIDSVTLEPMHSARNGRELLVGVVNDPVFGPAISFGAGGIAVEVLHDRAITLPPLNGFIARQLISQTRVAKLLERFRQMPAANLAAIEEVLLRVSELVCELPQIRELDLNPLIADENGAIAVDARIVVAYRVPSLVRYSHMAIHPYPAHLISHWTLADGTDITVRPIRPEDAKIEQTFVKRLSPESKYFRFMQALQELTPTMLVRFTQIDYHREMALIAVTAQNGEEVELGVARYTTNPDAKTCEFALVVADEWQHRGIGSRLMTELMQVAKMRGLDQIEGEVLADNQPMLGLMRALGFALRVSEHDPAIMVVTRTL